MYWHFDAFPRILSPIAKCTPVQLILVSISGIACVCKRCGSDVIPYIGGIIRSNCVSYTWAADHAVQVIGYGVDTTQGIISAFLLAIILCRLNVLCLNEAVYLTAFRIIFVLHCIV